jgi:hypothetical protein
VLNKCAKFNRFEWYAWHFNRKIIDGDAVELLFGNNPRNPPPADFCSLCPKFFKRVPFNADLVAESNGMDVM